jgi:paraquat-inducible protein A
MIQRLPELAAGEQALCARCDTSIYRHGSASTSVTRTTAVALAGLIFYFPAIFLPILKIERMGHQSESSILKGTWDLLTHGAWFVGGIILVFSIIVPLSKLVLLLVLCGGNQLSRRHQAWTYRFMEQFGRWGMLDVMLVALLVALIKLGDLVRFTLGPAVWAFALCILMSMLASALFDPHAIWEEDR